MMGHMATQVREDRTGKLGLEGLVVRLPWRKPMTDDELLAFSSLNPDLRVELSAEGDLIIMPPAGGATGRRNAALTAQLFNWAKQDGTGKTFDSSTGFRLPNGAVRSPDASWVSNSRLNTLTKEQWETYLPLCPEFVLELLSPTDTIKVAKDKMREYLDNGSQLGWLIDPQRRHVHVYTPGGVEALENPATVSADPLLSEFVLELSDLW